MSFPEESWLEVASTLGFDSEEGMLRHLYASQEFSIGDIARIVGRSTFTVRTRLMTLGVRLRGRGGPNNRQGKRKLLKLTDPELYNSTVGELVDKFGVHASTVSAERRLRERLREGSNDYHQR